MVLADGFVTVIVTVIVIERTGDAFEAVVLVDVAVGYAYYLLRNSRRCVVAVLVAACPFRGNSEGRARVFGAAVVGVVDPPRRHQVPGRRSRWWTCTLRL